MDTNEIRIRPATEADAEEILNIYAPYVTDTAITFEYDVPTLEEFTGRIRHTLEKYPYLVAVKDGPRHALRAFYCSLFAIAWSISLSSAARCSAELMAPTIGSPTILPF